VTRLCFSAFAAIAVLTVASAVAVAAPSLPMRQDAAPSERPRPATLNLADYMFGPPPHNHIDPGLRCWMRCPKKPPPPIAPR
jgi:hypothetical protein